MKWTMTIYLVLGLIISVIGLGCDDDSGNSGAVDASACNNFAITGTARSVTATDLTNIEGSGTRFCIFRGSACDYIQSEEVGTPIFETDNFVSFTDGGTALDVELAGKCAQNYFNELLITFNVTPAELGLGSSKAFIFTPVDAPYSGQGLGYGVLVRKGAGGYIQVVHHELVHMIEIALSGMGTILDDAGSPSHSWFSEGLAALISGSDPTPTSTSEVNTRISEMTNNNDDGDKNPLGYTFTNGSPNSSAYPLFALANKYIFSSSGGGFSFSDAKNLFANLKANGCDGQRSNTCTTAFEAAFNATMIPAGNTPYSSYSNLKANFYEGNNLHINAF